MRILSVHNRIYMCRSCTHERPPAKKPNLREIIGKRTIKKWIDLEQNTKPKFGFSTADYIERWTKPSPAKLFVVAFANIADYPVQDNQSTSIDDFELSKAAFKKFVKNNRRNPEYTDKYVVFVHGNLYGVGDTEVELVKKVYQNVGNVAMYMGSVSNEIRTELIESPELR